MKILVYYDDFSEVCETIDCFKIIEKYGDFGWKKMSVSIKKLASTIRVQ